MSRLDSAIRRLIAQRALIDFAARPGAIPEGPIFELGLGNGRTYDHLRERFGGRDIYVFERRVTAHPACIPDGDHLVLGDIEQTMTPLLVRLGRRAAFLHCDLGIGVAWDDASLGEQLTPILAQALAPGGLAASDQAVAVAGWEPLPLPDGIEAGRYFLYRNGSGIMTLP